MAIERALPDAFDHADERLRESRQSLFNAVANITRMLLVLQPAKSERRVLVQMRSCYEEQIHIINEIVGDEINHGPYRCPRSPQTTHPTAAKEVEAT